MELLVRRNTDDAHPVLPGTGPDLRFEVLRPVATQAAGPMRLRAFPDSHDISETNPYPAPSESHTINGNSVVLKLCYGDRTFLFGGDLNQPAQAYLAERYGDNGVFRVDVNKACHHGSSDFDLPFLQHVSPTPRCFPPATTGRKISRCTVPSAWRPGTAGGIFPLVFSPELARETSTTSVLLGHINACCNGETMSWPRRKKGRTCANPGIPSNCPMRDRSRTCPVTTAREVSEEQ